MLADAALEVVKRRLSTSLPGSLLPPVLTSSLQRGESRGPRRASDAAGDHVVAIGKVNRRTVQSVYADRAAAMIRVARVRCGSSKSFAEHLGSELGWGPLSRQAIYDWETGKSRVPAVAVFAAASINGLSVEELLGLADRFRLPQPPTSK